MTWDIDELVVMMRMGGFIKDREWEDEAVMKQIRRNAQCKLDEGYTPDLEYGKWVKPQDLSKWNN